VDAARRDAPKGWHGRVRPRRGVSIKIARALRPIIACDTLLDLAGMSETELLDALVAGALAGRPRPLHKKPKSQPAGHGAAPLEPPSRRAAEPPSRRAAEPPSRRAAEPPSRRAAEPRNKGRHP
jgi:hypothetical protein